MPGPLDGYTAPGAGFGPGEVAAVKPDHAHGTFGALLSSAAPSIAPTAAGVATFGAGAGPGAALGMAVGGPIGGALGGLLGGGIASFAGSTVAEKAQDFAVSQLPASAIKGTAFDPEIQAQDQANHPYASTIGSVLPQALFLRPGLSLNLAGRAIGATVAGATEAGSEYGRDGSIDPVKVGIHTILGAALDTETSLGRTTGAAGKVAADSIIRGAAAAGRWVNRPAPTGTNLVVGDQAGGAQFNDINGLDQSGYHSDPQTGAVTTFATAREAGRFATSNDLGDRFNVENVGNGRFALRKSAPQVYADSLGDVPEDAKAAAVQAAERAGTIDERATAAQASSNLGVNHPEEDASTPDERAALHVSSRENDAREASPLHSDPVGTGANADRLAAMEAWLGVTGRVADVPSPAPLPAAHNGGDLTTAINRAEGVGKNPKSSAEGHGQFLRSTWLDVYRRNFDASGMTDAQVLALRNDKAVGDQMTAIYGRENGAGLRRAGLEDSPGNISLAHFLGLGGARDLLKADPNAPVESLLPAKVIAANERVLAGKTAADVIAWAHRRIGNASGQPVARGDAVPQWDFETDAVPDDAPPIATASFRPDEITTDAGLMQYKSGGDENGVTDRLRGVDQWNPIYSGKGIVWQGNDGRNVIVDGHQRLGLAQRLYPNDPSIRIDAMVLREADGVSPQMARAIGALKNIAEGSGDAVDAARILRDAPAGLDLPRVGDTLAAQAHGLASLSNEAFGAVLNNVVDPAHASRIGRVLPDKPSQHMAMVGLLRDAKPRSAAEAEAIVRQANADGFGAPQEHQLGMFGDEPQTSLYGPAARVLEGAKRTLRNEKATFSTLARDASRIEGAGNVLDRDANKARVQGNEQAIAIIEAAAHTTGPVRTALLAAARRSLAGDHAGAIREFADAARSFDLKDVAAGLGESGGDSVSRDEPGFAFDDPQADDELADGRGLPGGSTPGDDAAASAKASEGFSEPAGPAAEQQTQSVEHDLLMDLPEGTFRLSEEGDEQTAQALLKDADADLAAVDKVRACMVPPKGEA